MKLLPLIVQKSLLLALCLFLFACSDNEVANNKNYISDAVAETDPILPSLGKVPDAKDKYVAVLLGYGYNEGTAKDNLLAALEQEYGFIENAGIIIPLIYPDDFVSFGYERISLLPERIEEQLSEYVSDISDSPLAALAALITLGAPDGTHGALATLQDATIQDTEMQISVFSIFSQDDVLGTESGSDLVIDYSPVETEAESEFHKTEEKDLSYPNDVFQVIVPLINAALDWQEIKGTGLLIPALRTEFLKRTACNLFVYVDPQTGLRSKNHYVLKDTVKESP